MSDKEVMKDYDKSSIFTGVLLLALASFFSISLILQPLDFGIAGPGHDNIFFKLGNLLYSVYGFSSILIPVFLFIAGLSCFASKWTARKSMRLVTALVPFFTCVITENLCRSIIEMGGSEFTNVKVAVVAITGLMLVIIEFLGIGIIADKISMKKKKDEPVETESYSELEGKFDDDFDFSEDDFIEEEDLVKASELEDEETVVDEEETIEDEHEKTTVHRSSPSIFDNAIPTDVFPLHSNQSEKSKEISEDIGEIIEEEKEEEKIKNKVEEVIEETIAEQKEEPVEEDSAIEVNGVEAVEENLNAVPENNSESMITQEEFAALTETSAPADELEWPNLAPAVTELPPEYVADFDENDPALDFPPKDEESKDEEKEQEQVEDQNDKEEPVELEDIGEIEDVEDIDIEDIKEDPVEKSEEETDKTEIEDEDVDDDDFSDIGSIELDDDFESEDEDVEEEDSEKSEKKDNEYNFDEIDIDFGNVFKNESEEEEKEQEEDNLDDIDLDFGDFGLGLMDDEKPGKPVNNSKFPNRIVIHNGDELQDDEENTLESEKKNNYSQKFPGKIDLGDDFDENDDSDEGLTYFSGRDDSEEDSDKTEEFSEEYEEDVTLPLPEFSLEDEKNFEEAATIDEELEEANEIPETDSVDEIIMADNQFLDSLAVSRKPSEIHFDGSDVFSEMEDDIRKDQEEKLAALNEDVTDYVFTSKRDEVAPRENRYGKTGPYKISSNLLVAYKDDEYWVIDDDTKEDAANLKQTLSEFNIDADVIDIKKGPVVTMFEILPAPGVRLSKIVQLQDNIALSLAAQSVRIVAPIPGKQAVGIEVPNKKRSVVGFRELIELESPEWDKMAVPVVLGKDILGRSQIIDLVKTPHMLIAGATGSGKSVCVNSLILSILFKRSYKDVKLILVDPKVVELKLYNDIPHLLTPVITEPKKALRALQYCLCEMERRYALLDSMGVRDISNYNQKIKEQNICTEKLPYIVVIIDEFADLMATSGKELESIVARLTAMSRAVGIHLVLATQRPSVNVITGLIKANIPTRIAFMVASRTDSNIIIDSVGAEKLLGRGDMLYASAVDPAPIRIQGTFVSDQEVEDVVNAVKEYGEPDYLDEEIFEEDEETRGTDLFGEPVSDDDPLYDQALEIVVQAGKASASYIQRKLKIGYNRAARLVEEMEDRGIVGPANGSKPREIIHIP